MTKLTALVLSTVATTALADPAKLTTANINDVDETRWCVYAGTPYSKGAVVTTGEGQTQTMYVCTNEHDFGPGANRLVWKEKRERAL